MAQLGDQLIQPEAGWKRIDGNNDKIEWSGNYRVISTSDGRFYGSTSKFIMKSGGNINFYFKGDRLRILSSKASSRATDINITIDGILNKFSAFDNSSGIFIYIVFEELYLSNTIHHVEIMVDDIDRDFLFDLDAIDINSNGYLLTEEEYHKLNSDLYLIYDDNKYKSIFDDNILEILDYKSEFIKNYYETKCIKNLNDIPPYIQYLSNKFNIIKRKVI